MILATKSENIILTATIESCQIKTNPIGKKMSEKKSSIQGKMKRMENDSGISAFFLHLEKLCHQGNPSVFWPLVCFVDFWRNLRIFLLRFDTSANLPFTIEFQF